MEVQQNLKDVIRKANQAASDKGTAVGVAWVTSPGEWVIYDLQDGLPEGHEPELVCFSQGVMPLAVTKTALESLHCAIQEVVNDWDRKSDLTKEQTCLLKKSI